MSASTFVAAEVRSRRLVVQVEVATPAGRPARGDKDIDDRHAGVPVSDLTHGDGAEGRGSWQSQCSYP
jgi:hypothetical protein